MTKSARVQLRTQSPFSEIHFFCKSLHQRTSAVHQHTSAVHQWTAQCIGTQVHWHTSAVQQFSVVQKCINTLLCNAYCAYNAYRAYCVSAHQCIHSTFSTLRLLKSYGSTPLGFTPQCSTALPCTGQMKNLLAIQIHSFCSSQYKRTTISSKQQW